MLGDWRKLLRMGAQLTGAAHAHLVANGYRLQNDGSWTLNGDPVSWACVAEYAAREAEAHTDVSIDLDSLKD